MDEDEVIVAPRFDAAEHETYDEADVHALRMDSSLPADFREDENAIFLARQLDYVRARVYSRKLPNMKGALLVPTSTEIPEWAETVRQRQYDEVGMAKIISNYADDLPRADVRAKETTIRVHDLGNAYGYNISEIRASRANGTGLDVAKGNAARRAQEEKINRIVLRGEPEYGLFGLLNHPNIPVILTLNGDWLNPATTAQMIYDDLVAMFNAISDQSNGVHRPNFLGLPLAKWQAANSKIIPDTGGQSALEFFLRKHPGIQVEDVFEFKGAGLNGEGGGEDMIMMYERDIENLRHELVMPFNQLPAQVRNLETVVNCIARTAGVQIDYPMAFVKAAGI